MSIINMSEFGFSEYPSYQRASTFASSVFKSSADQKSFTEMVGFGSNGNPSSLNNWYKSWQDDSDQNNEKYNNFDSLKTVLLQSNFEKNFEDIQYWVTWILCRYFGNPALIYDSLSENFVPVYNYNSEGIREKGNCVFVNTDIGNPGDTRISGCVFPYISVIGNIRYTPMQDLLHNWIFNCGGAATNFLKTLSNSLKLSRSEISSSSVLLDWFGCFVDPPALPSGVKLTPQCDPLCVRVNTIKLYNKGNPNAIECTGSVCILDNVSINASGNSGGAIELNQICPGCTQEGNCKCVVNVNTPGLLDRIGVDDGSGLSNSVIFNQYCPGAICMTFDEVTSEVKIVDCANNINESKFSIFESFRKNKNFWLLFIAGICIFLLYFFAAKYGSSQGNATVPPGGPFKSDFQLPKEWNGKPISSVNLSNVMNYSRRF